MPSASPIAKKLKVQMHEDVARLLNYAAKQPNISIKPEFLDRIVPILCRDADNLTEQDHIELWHAHNHLSNLLSPVTAESLEVIQEVNAKKSWLDDPKRILITLTLLMAIAVTLVLYTQAYSIKMGKNIDAIKALNEKYAQFEHDKELTLKSQPQPNPILDASLNKQEDTLNKSIEELLQRQAFLNSLAPELQSDNCNPFKNDSQTNILDHAQTINQCADTISFTVNALFLPMLLGLMGAVAFIARSILNQLSDATFNRPSLIKYIMRITLGGLLGVIGPWLYTSGKVEQVGLELALFAFLLGYSVELAFTIFDNFIKFLREKIKLGNEAKTNAINESPITLSIGDKVSRYDTPPETDTSKPTSEATDFLKTMESYRSSLMELTELAPLLETVTLPEYFQAECAPKLAKAAELLQQLDSYQTTTPDITTLAKASSDFTDACKQLTGENHPLAAILDNAVKSFKDVSINSDLSIIESFVVTLFTAAIAAFSKDANVYSRWKAYAWLESFKAANINGLEITDACIEACLTNAPLFQTAFDNNHLSPNALCKAIAASENLDTLAEQLWSDPSLVQLQPADLESLFGTLSVFTEATNEFGFSLLRYMLEKIDFPEGHFNADTRLLSVTETLQCLDTFRQNQASEKDLDLLCHLSIELMRRAQTSTSLDAVGLIQRLMPAATSASTNP